MLVLSDKNLLFQLIQLENNPLKIHVFFI
jgi:hypothetical protein